MSEPLLADPAQQVDSKKSFIGAPTRRLRPKATALIGAARLYWMLAGNATLYLIAVAIAQQGHQRASSTDVAFFAAVGSLILVRYLDIARLDGATASGEAASLGDWHRYAACLLPLSVAVWMIARVIAWIGFL